MLTISYLKMSQGNDQAPNNTDDDSIFMSLGEIPLSKATSVSCFTFTFKRPCFIHLSCMRVAAFLQTWDQPPARGYEKPF